MSLEDNKILVQQFIDEVMNAGNTAAIADFCVAGSMFAGGIEGQIKAMIRLKQAGKIRASCLIHQFWRHLYRLIQEGCEVSQLIQ